MKIVKGVVIIKNKEISELDRFTLDFVKIIEKFTNYVLVSGYVSILLGRSRGSEDVDIIIPKLQKKDLVLLLKEILKEFYCLNTSLIEEMYDYLIKKNSIRFAKEGTVIPNMEVKIVKNSIEQLALDKRLKVDLGEAKMYISPLELQVAFKEEVLKSPKDFEDAKHLRMVFDIDNKKIEKFKVKIREIY